MQQLSGTDNVMLYSERRNIYNHVAALCVYDVTTAPGGKVRCKDVLQHFDQRLHLHPLFRHRLVPRRSASTAPTGSRTATSTSNTTSATSRCPSPATGAS